MLPTIRLVSLILSLVIVQKSESSNILISCCYPSESHHVLALALSKGLIKRGHNITLMTSYPVKENIANLTHFEVEEVRLFKEVHFDYLYQNGNNFFERLRTVSSSRETHRVLMRSKAFNSILNSNTKYDLLIQNIIFESAVVLAHHFDIPVIGFATMDGIPPLNHFLGNTIPHSFVPNILSSYSDEMVFHERVMNTIFDFAWYAWKYSLDIPSIDDAIEEHFSNYPNFVDILDRVDLALIASHPSMETPKPHLPNMIQIGGFQLQEADKLPVDLQEIMDRSSNGVVYFSLGTNVKLSQFPEEKLKMFVNVLSKLPLTVLWKYDGAQTYQYKNIIIRKWFPQQSVLAHQNIKVFITHGGHGSILETLYHNVPTICIPFAVDQYKSCKGAAKNGYSVTVHFDGLNEEDFTTALNKTINDGSYRKSMEPRSDLLKNQPVTPMDNAAFWIEYVIRNKGAKHLKANIKHLSWYQLYLLDVYGFLFLVIIVLSYFMCSIVKLILKLTSICRRIENKEKTN